jgi:hypothetical protein
MKTIAIIIASFALASCGLPVNLSARYSDPSTGIDFSGGYSSKRGIVIDVSK